MDIELWKAAATFGVPFVILVAIGVGIWKAAKYWTVDVIIPVTKQMVMTLVTQAESSKKTAESVEKIGEVLEKLADNMTELKKSIDEKET